MSVIPKVQIVVVVLMIVDLAALIMLSLTNTKDGDNVWLIIFYVVSIIGTILGVIYLCGTKPPKDIAKLMAGHKELLSQFKSMNKKHQEDINKQK